MKEIDLISLDRNAEYIGEVLQDKANGEGVLIFENGTTFEGEWNDGNLHHGICSTKNGEKYIGEFSNLKKNGLGSFSNREGYSYTGYWSNDKFNGRGILINNDALTSGSWLNGDLDQRKRSFTSKAEINFWTIPRIINNKKYIPIFKEDSLACIYLSTELQKEFITEELLESLNNNIFVSINNSYSKGKYKNNISINREDESMVSKKIMASDLVREADICREKNDFSTAINLYSQSLKLFPTSQGFWGRGSSKSFTGDYLGAQEDFDNGSKWNHLENKANENISDNMDFYKKEHINEDKNHLFILLNKWQLVEDDLSNFNNGQKLRAEELLEFYGFNKELFFKLDSKSSF